MPSYQYISFQLDRIRASVEFTVENGELYAVFCLKTHPGSQKNTRLSLLHLDSCPVSRV